MVKNMTLSAAKSAKNDEFYTQYANIQKEVNALYEQNGLCQGMENATAMEERANDEQCI